MSLPKQVSTRYTSPSVSVSIIIKGLGIHPFSAAGEDNRGKGKESERSMGNVQKRH